ncbi:NAD(P)H-dependent glycerol-3-phosphate dehydrogenase [Haloferula rosea]|uniref:Glycerol-3-phosphate dehydrogenase [NAD(P)+] n=1 Tax=Haloferula rosea TaxID=490093 RepID=A0A934VHM4_9BACT|nr:NAD(P)H-dependent glycerol-3-phosphate dehydrogenase [Haloferula rosea]MBK1828830.1 NAD(P)-dependent glycerol-3-phosphate dehydrogenase [Haloferula rosea]
MIQRAAILGTGSFGTALAHLIGQSLQEVVMVGRDPEVAEGITRDHRNPRYMTKSSLPASVRATTRLEEAASGFPLILFCVPTSATRETATQLANAGLDPQTALLSCAKGIERGTGERMSTIIEACCPGHPVAVLSGPNHAEEIATDLATCAVIGCCDEALARDLQTLFTSPNFRSYTSDDLAGIELGGAIKNVYAIAAGITSGLGLGDNAIAALVTRALAEMTRLGVQLGGRIETFSGLSGVGDLIATCFSVHSRNHRVGLALGEGRSLKEAVDQLGMVAEGVPNTQSIYEAARRVGARTPIIDAVYAVLYEHKPAGHALKELLTRDPRPETD